MVVPIKVPSMGQMELINHLQRIICSSNIEPYSSVQIVYIEILDKQNW